MTQCTRIENIIVNEHIKQIYEVVFLRSSFLQITKYFKKVLYFKLSTITNFTNL